MSRSAVVLSRPGSRGRGREVRWIRVPRGEAIRVADSGCQGPTKRGFCDGAEARAGTQHNAHQSRREDISRWGKQRGRWIIRTQRRRGSCDPAPTSPSRYERVLAFPDRCAALQGRRRASKLTSVGQSIRPRDERPQSNGPAGALRHFRPRSRGKLILRQ